MTQRSLKHCSQQREEREECDYYPSTSWLGSQLQSSDGRECCRLPSSLLSLRSPHAVYRPWRYGRAFETCDELCTQRLREWLENAKTWSWPLTLSLTMPGSCACHHATVAFGTGSLFGAVATYEGLADAHDVHPLFGLVVTCGVLAAGREAYTHGCLYV